jgi:hypothetical protein
MDTNAPMESDDDAVDTEADGSLDDEDETVEELNNSAEFEDSNDQQPVWHAKNNT